MTAIAKIVEAVAAAGGALAVNGGKLKVTAPKPLPDALVDELRRCKPDIVAALSKWGADEWRMYFDERAAIAEHDGELSSDEAEALAFQCCVIHWLNENFESSSAGRCAWCCEVENNRRVVLPFGTENHGHVWLHSECWQPWQQKRYAEAVAALAGFGIFRVENAEIQESARQ